MRHLTILLLCVLTLLAASCRSTRHAASTPLEAVEEAVPAQQKRQHTVTNFSATVEGVSVNGQLRHVQDSALWVSVTKLVELGRALATRDSVWVSAPMMDVQFAGTYDDLSRKAGRTLTFEQLQQMATSPDAEQSIARLATEMGFHATVSLGERRQVETLAVPYRKPKPANAGK